MPKPTPPAPAPPLSGIEVAVPLTILAFVFWLIMLVAQQVALAMGWPW